MIPRESFLEPRQWWELNHVRVRDRVFSQYGISKSKTGKRGRSIDVPLLRHIGKAGRFSDDPGLIHVPAPCRGDVDLIEND